MENSMLKAVKKDKSKAERASEITGLIKNNPNFNEEPKKHLSFEISESRYEKINLYKLKSKKKSIKNIIEDFIDSLTI